jgi:hypothetical protein
MDTDVTGYLERMSRLARRAKKVFFVAVLICGVLALNFTVLGGRSAGALARARSCFGPLLFWALTAAAYAFHSLAQAHVRMTRKVEGVLSAERQRALRQLAHIKARLREAGGASGQ